MKSFIVPPSATKDLEEAATMRERAEAAFHGSEANFRTLFEQAAVGVAQVETRTGRFARVNRRYCEIVGYAEEELRRLTFHEITHPEDLAADLESMARLTRGGIHDFSVEKRYLRKDGAIVWVNLSVSAPWNFGSSDFHTAVVEDITERKRAEDALREEEHLLSESQRIAQIGSWRWELSGPIKWTDETYRIYGVSPESFAPTVESVANLIHPDDRSAVQRWSDACRAGESPDDLEYRVVQRDGSIRLLNGRGKLICDAEGKPAYMSGTVQNITARKQAEAAVQRGVKELRVLYQASLVFSQSRNPGTVGHHIIETTTQLNYERASIWIKRENDSKLELLAHSDLGLEPDVRQRELARVRSRISRLGEGISGWVALHGEAVRTGDVKRDPRYVEGDPAIQSELCVPLKVDGRIIGSINVESYLSNAFSEHDEQLLTTLANHAVVALENARLFHELELDLAERKRAEEELRASKQRVRDIFTFAPVGIYQSLYDGTLIAANKSLAEMLGYASVDELLKVNLDSGVYFAADERQKLIREYEGPGYVADLDTVWKRKDGSPICIQLTAHAIKRSTGETEYFEGFVRDITARKQTERELEESDKQLRALLARVRRTREEERVRVSREIHDELGQLLTGLKMDMRWLERKLAEPGLPAALNPLLDRAVEASELADATIAAVQRIAAELRPGTLEKLGLEASLSQEARRFQERSGVRCTVVLPETRLRLPPEVASELFYICQEALTNVARHAKARNVEIRLLAADDNVMLQVSDDGVGMSKAESKSSRSLGLVGMRERAMQCGGTISFTPNQPRGVRVTVRVPGGGVESGERARQ